MDKFNLREYLKNNPLLKENIDFPELEDEFEGAMDAMVVEPEIYLQDIIDDPSVVLGDDYFEVYNAVEDGIYSEDEAVELAKKWATDKLSSLAENKTLNEEVSSRFIQKYLSEFNAEDFEIEDIESYSDRDKAIFAYLEIGPGIIVKDEVAKSIKDKSGEKLKNIYKIYFPIFTKFL